MEQDKAMEGEFDLNLLLRFLTYIRPHIPVLLLAIGIIIIQIALDLSLPYLLREAVDGPIENQNYRGLYLYTGLFVGALLGNGLARFAQTYLTHLIGQNLMHDLRTDIFDHMQSLDVSYFDSQPVGRLVTRVSNDVESLQDLFTSGLVMTFSDLLLVLGIAGMLLYLNMELALITFTVLPFLAIIAWWFRRNARQLYRETRKKLARVNSFLQERLMGMDVIKVFNREEEEFDRFREENNEYRERMVDTVFYYGIFYPAIAFIGYMVTALLVWWGGGQILAGTLTLGTFLAFWYYTKKFFRPLRSITRRYNVFQSALASSERIFRLLDTEPSITSPEDPEPAVFRDKIAFKNVHFAYEEDEPVLTGLHMKIHRGESIAIAGTTGAGKTTIINLLMRYYEPDRGEIRMDGTHIKHMKLPALRSLFGIVRQDIELFSGTLRENVTLGKEVKNGRIQEVVEKAHLTDVMDRLPEGLESSIGEEGASLSAGECQLLSIARVLLFDPELILFDEATGNVDAGTEKKVQNAIRHTTGNRTAILIAHRLSTISRADRVLVLKDGQIVEEGSPRELREKGQEFARLYETS